jgi:hypothetical protein
MKRVIRLTESDLTKIVSRVIEEQKNEELLTEGISDILKKIKSKFSKQKEEKLESEVEENLGVNKNSTKQEVIDSVKDFFGQITSKDEIMDIASSLGSVFKLFTYIVLIIGANYVSDNDPITFLGIALYMFLQLQIKVGDKTFKFRN